MDDVRKLYEEMRAAAPALVADAPRRTVELQQQEYAARVGARADVFKDGLVTCIRRLKATSGASSEFYLEPFGLAKCDVHAFSVPNVLPGIQRAFQTKYGIVVGQRGGNVVPGDEDDIEAAVWFTT